jgi:hypothetical protein
MKVIARVIGSNLSPLVVSPFGKDLLFVRGQTEDLNFTAEIFKRNCQFNKKCQVLLPGADTQIVMERAADNMEAGIISYTFCIRQRLKIPSSAASANTTNKRIGILWDGTQMASLVVNFF